MAEEEDPFMELFNEFEAFKETSQAVEERQQKTIDELTAEVRRQKRLAAEAENAKSEYLQRLNSATSGEEDLRSEIQQLKNLLAEQKREKVRLENEVEKYSSDQRKQQFTLQRLQSESDVNADKVIMLEQDFEDVKANLNKAKGEASQAKEQLSEMSQQYDKSLKHRLQLEKELTEEKAKVAAAGPSASDLATPPRASSSNKLNAAIGSQDFPADTIKTATRTSSFASSSANGRASGGTNMSPEAAAGLHAVAERLKRIAEKCRQRPNIVGSGLNGACLSASVRTGLAESLGATNEVKQQ